MLILKTRRSELTLLTHVENNVTYNILAIDTPGAPERKGVEYFQWPSGYT